MNGPSLELMVFIDVICPWCYVGKRRMEKALPMLRDIGPIRVSWLPFQLNPDMPKEGMERRAYRMRKFGSWEHSQRLDAQIKEAGAQEGIAFRHDLMTRTPNTFDAHRVISLSRRQEGAQDALVEALFRAYFSEGADIGDSQVLAGLCSKAGLERDHVLAFLKSQEGAEEVLWQEGAARRAGISGVPAFIVNGFPFLMGAHPPEAIAAALRKALPATKTAQTAN